VTGIGVRWGTVVALNISWGKEMDVSGTMHCSTNNEEQKYLLSDQFSLPIFRNENLL
jgi:hypothetical protein